MKIKVSSLGCRLNDAEIESVITALRDRGHEITRGNDADAFIINSCVVTLQSERKTRKLIYQSLRSLQPGPGSIVLVTGCYAEKIKREENIIFIPNDYKNLVPDIIENPALINSIDENRASRFSYAPALKALRTRINLKIQDGCDNFCSYCIIPHVRGAPTSRPFNEVMKEFDVLLENGCREIVLTGVMIGKYRDNSRDLAALLSEMLNREGSFRVHISSLSPGYATDEIIRLAGHDKLVKHLHLSLQSGSDKIIRAMNRHYTGKQYMDIIDRIRTTVPLFNFTTDVIVGFPGETEKDFLDTVDLIKKARFSHVHTFRFSPRPGTAAAAMQETVEELEKTRRSHEVIELFNRQKEDYYGMFDGQVSTILTERPRKGKSRGFNEYYIPVEMDTVLPRNEFHTIKTTYRPGSKELSGSVITEVNTFNK